MSSDPRRRFSSRVEDYVRYRPSYPREIIPLLERECGLTRDSVIADAGSGTGFLAKIFLDYGCEVIGVEPNAAMRTAGEDFLADFQRFTSLDGRAEATGLPSTSVDIATAGQAFHWFEPKATRAEFSRILRPPGYVVLIWNERIVPETGFLAGYEQLLHRYAPEYKQVDHRRIDAASLTAFFGHDQWNHASLPNAQRLDWQGVRGRLMSSSYTPLPGSEAHAPMMEELQRIFDAHQAGGQIDFVYETNINYGTLR